jgi:hypothetical protein
MTTVAYKGYGNDNPAGGRLVVRVAEDGAEEPLRHIVRHSPTGMTWGYGGSGPADLARSLLFDALGDRGRCAMCAGSGRIEYVPAADGDVDEVPASAEAVECGSADTCWQCKGDGIRSDLPYQAYKFDVVARLPETTWTITTEEVEAWMDSQAAQQF